jgi:hypothetical protein
MQRHGFDESLMKTYVFSDSINQNGGNQMNPIWKKEGKNLTPCIKNI